ncbi:hypothetical protein SDC9_108464 [bioreactor metagenome]|uniref:Uncharacterized protein n=1 Tax=bioreactor metagenome TaxID=1076179 RepID=A0A645BIP0_9ZZZZ
MCLIAQPFVDAAVGQQLGDEAARHDGAFVDIERHTLQPRLACEVGCGLAGGDALVDQLLHLHLLLGGDGMCRHAVGRAVERQAQLPEHQPRGLVVRIGRAMAVGHASRVQPLCCFVDQSANGGRVAAHARSAPVWSSCSVRR